MTDSNFLVLCVGQYLEPPIARLVFEHDLSRAIYVVVFHTVADGS